jgi:hypothetical protein
MAKPKVFKDEQLLDPLVLNGRPPTAAGLPVALAHPVLGAFRDNVARDIEPDTQAVTTVLELSEVLCELSEKDEGSRAGRVKEILNNYVGLNFVKYYFGNLRNTDGSIVRKWGEFEAMLATMEMKQELGMGGGCPYLQSSAYFIEFIRFFEEKEVSRLSRLPALLVYVAGPYIGVAGAAFLGLPVVEPMTPMMPLYHLEQNELLLAAARMLSALKTALVDLDGYYKNLAQEQMTSPSTQQLQLEFPYVNRVCIGENEARLTYASKLDGGFTVFRGNAEPGSHDVVIKFVRRYSRTCHEECHRLGIAPKLLAFERLPGGWYVVVMEWLRNYKTLHSSKSTRSLTDAVNTAVQQLHDKGFVHGDLRSPNIMVGPQNSIAFIDFDWAGKVGEAVYPSLMNSVINWHGDAKPGGKILPNHDMHMLKLELREHS